MTAATQATPRKIKRHEQIVRQWLILLALDRARPGLTFRQILDGLEAARRVSERTLRRDVDALILAGFPIEVKSGKGSEHALITVLEREHWHGGERTIFAVPGGAH